MTSLTAPPAPNAAFLIPVLAAANFAIGMGAFVVIGVLSPIADAFGVSEARAGWLMTVYAAAYAVGSPLCVALTGRLPRRTVLAAGLLTFAAGAAATATAPSEAALHAARIVAALGAGVVSPVAAGVAAAASAPEARGRALAAAFFGVTLAQVVGVPAGAWIGYAIGWEAVFWITAALALAALGGILALVPRDMPFQASALSALGAALIDPRTLFAILYTLLTMAGVYTFFTYAGPVLEASMGFGGGGVSLFLLIFGLGAVAGNILGGALTDRIGAYRTLIFVSVTQIVCMPVYSILPIPAWALYAHVFLWSVGGWSFAASQQTRLVALGPERANVMLALNAAAIYVGVSLGSSLGGAVIAGFGLWALGLAGAMVGALALAILVVSERTSR